MSCHQRACFSPHRRLPPRLRSLAAAALLATPFLLAADPARAQQAGYGQTLGTTPMERQLYEGGTGKPAGTILDTTNPLDLMNKIRRGTAMDDATPPASAIDQALQQLEAQSAPPPRPAMTSSGQGAQPAPVPSAAPTASSPVWTVQGNPAGSQPAPASVPLRMP